LEKGTGTGQPGAPTPCPGGPGRLGGWPSRFKDPPGCACFRRGVAGIF